MGSNRIAMTTLYYLPKAHISGNLASLPQEEAHHAVNVVRHKAGDMVYAVDGEGGWYQIRLTRVGKRIADGEILDTQLEYGEPAYKLTVGLAVLKNQKRFDLFVEKAAELGVSKIVPLVTSRTEKKSIKEDRIRKILRAAMKQCGRSRLIELSEVRLLNAFLNEVSDSLLLCCHEREKAESALYKQLESYSGEREATVIVGPEGGFTDEEIDQVQSTGFKLTSLGTRRLRAETAAIAVSTGVMLHWS